MYENDQAEILALPVWPLLWGHLWHATSIAASAAINSEGVIRVGDDGVGYAIGHCRMNDCVSLFDFSGPLEDIASQWMNWRGWFGHQTHIAGKASVWLQIDRAKVAGTVQTVAETAAAWWAAPTKGNHMPHVEVCHWGPVPTNAMVGALVISNVDPSRFQMIEPGTHWQTRIEAFVATLPEPPPPDPLMRALREASRRSKR
jgi:hypothetical protein